MKARRFVSFGNLGVGALLMLAVWALCVWVASRPALKALIDLTPQRVNSVDPVTIELLRELRGEKAEIQLHLLAPPLQGEAQTDFERQFLTIRSRLADLTRQLLKTYQYLGGEAVTVVDHDFNAIDQPALREAAQRFDYKVAEGDVLVVAVRQAGKELRHRKLSLLTDLAVIDVPNSGMPGTGGKASLPVLKDFQGELAISSALKSLLVMGVPVCYVLKNGKAPGSDSNSGTPAGYDSLFLALQQAGFDVRALNLREAGAVPADASLVMLIEPRLDLQEREANAVHEYLKRGGRAVLNYCWNGPEPDMNPDGGKLGELLGFRLSKKPVFHLIRDGSGRTQGPGFSGDKAVAKLILQYSLHPAVRRLAEAQRWVEMANALEVQQPKGGRAGLRHEALLATGEYAWLADPGADGYPSYEAPRKGLERKITAMAIELDPAPAEGGKSDGGKSTADARPGVVVVFGGMFAINEGMRAGFGDLALSVCNWLVERKVLLGIKSSRYEAKHLALQPPQRERIFWFLIAGVPGVFLVLGVTVVMLRRRQ